MDNFVKVIGVVVVSVVLIALFGMVPVYFLWNWLCPQLFHLPEVSLMQALGLLILCGFLFKSSNNKSK